MDARFPAIQQLTTAQVRAVVRRALRDGLDTEAIADFLASVDWSGLEQAEPAVKSWLGELEGWATAYAEGELTRVDYRSRLSALLTEPLPAPAR